MTAPYFNFPSRFVPRTKIKSSPFNSLFDAVVAGFGAAQTDVATARGLADQATSLSTTANSNAASALSVATNAASAIAGATTASNAATAAANSAATTANAALSRAGGTMAGAIVLAANATQAMHPVTLQQMQAAVAGLSGGTSGGITSFMGRTTLAAVLQGSDITGLGSLTLNAPNSYQVMASGQNTASFGRIGNAVVVAENFANSADSLRIGADHVARIYLGNVQQMSVDGSGNTIVGGLLYARTGGAGTAGMGIGRQFRQLLTDPLPTGLVDGDVIYQFAG